MKNTITIVGEEQMRGEFIEENNFTLGNWQEKC